MPQPAQKLCFWTAELAKLRCLLAFQILRTVRQAAETPTSVLSASVILNHHSAALQGTSPATSNNADSQTRELNAHPLCIFSEEWQDEDGNLSEHPVVSVQMREMHSEGAYCHAILQHCWSQLAYLYKRLPQACSSHAINISSEECSCAPSELRPDEATAACSSFLVIHCTPIGQGTFGTVFK